MGYNPNQPKPGIWMPGRRSHNLWRGCVGCWPIWEGAGFQTVDLAHGNHGTLVNCEVADWESTLYGSAWGPDAQDEHIILPTGTNKPYCVTGDRLTVFAHLRPDFTQVLGANGWVVDNTADAGGNENSNGYRLMFLAAIDDWRWRTLTSAGAVNCDTTGLTWTAGSWHSLAGTYDGANMRIYWDGKLKNTAAQTGILTTTNHDPRIGNRSEPLANDFFVGCFSIVLIWDRDLSPGEITELAREPCCMIRPPNFAPFWDVAAVGGVARALVDGGLASYAPLTRGLVA